MFRITKTLCSCLIKKQGQVSKINELPRAFFNTSSSLNVKEVKSEVELPGKDWNILYALPGIRQVYVISRIKFHIPAVILGVGLPGILIAQYMEQLAEGVLEAFLITAFFNTVFLSSAVLPLTNVVGYIHIKNDKSEIMTTSLDFWGKPQKVITPVENIKIIRPKFPFENKLFFKYQIGDDDSNYIKLLRSKAEVTDYETFTNIFGYDVLQQKKR